jgi:hypothetical protein
MRILSDEEIAAIDDACRITGGIPDGFFHHSLKAQDAKTERLVRAEYAPILEANKAMREALSELTEMVKEHNSYIYKNGVSLTAIKVSSAIAALKLADKVEK